MFDDVLRMFSGEGWQALSQVDPADPVLAGLHALSDFLIGLAYVAISLTLVYLVRRARGALPFSWVFVAFGAFIVACGVTHFMHVLALATPAGYWPLMAAQAITVVASVVTALALPPVVPQVLALVEAAKVSEERRVQLETTNRELGGLYARLKELDQVKTQFFANLSHELRTPLTLILGPVKRLLTTDRLAPAQRRDLEVMERNARTLLKHVNDLLDVAKLEAGKMGVNYVQVDLARLVRLTAAHFRALAQDRGIDFLVETPPTVVAQADPEKLQRVLLNLLSNAFKFTPDGGQVGCQLRVERGRAQFIVQDTGPGVPPELRETIFERFQQGDGSATRQRGGTGLGLAIAKEFVELHGGVIGVDAAPGGGARFRVEVPLAAPSEVAVAPAATESSDAEDMVRQAVEDLRPRIAVPMAPAQAQDTTRPLVLVVEDNPDMNRFVAEILAAEYRVACAFDGREGMEQTLALQPDLVLSDVMMPNLSGDQMVREMRTHPALDATPIILLTAKADDELRVHMLAAGAQDYLVKPFSPEELRARVGNLLAMKRVRETLQQQLESQSRDIVALADEVTARNRDLKAALEGLHAAVRARDEFLSMAAHELKTPITSLRGFTQLALRQLARDGTLELGLAQQALATIDDQSQKLSHLVTQLLDVSRIEAGRLALERMTVDVVSLARSVVMTAQVGTTRHTIMVHAEGAAPAWVDPLRLEQVLSNLVDNAKKYSPDGGPIDITVTAPDPETLRIAVQDHGIGISQEDQSHIFDRFYQAYRGSGAAGMGLGLYISRQIVELHGGKITVESQPGAGTCFFITLPTGPSSVSDHRDGTAKERQVQGA